MKIKQNNQLITFKQSQNLDSFSSPVVPASKALPEWYKQQELLIDDTSKPWDASTIKGCMPVFDAMTQGYIIPLWSDVYVESIENDMGEIDIQFTWPIRADKDLVSGHLKEQTKGMPIMETSLGGSNAYKFNNPWLITTPKGYSTLFVSPLNNVNPQFEMISAIVATDSYTNFINFPFVWKGTKDWKGVITQGTPLIQLIPFKRDNFRHEIGSLTKRDEDDIKSNHLAQTRQFKDSYKRLWRKLVRSV